MADEPTLGEVMRLLQATVQRLDEVARKMDERETVNAKTYLRQDVYLAQRQADHAVVADLQGDLSGLAHEIKATEQKRSNNAKWAIGTFLATVAALATIFGALLQMGPPT